MPYLLNEQGDSQAYPEEHGERGYDPDSQKAGDKAQETGPSGTNVTGF